MMAARGPIRVHFAPVGCPKANVDREKSAWQLGASGFRVEASPGRAEFVVVYACGFIDDAKREAVADILGWIDLKSRGAIKGIVVAGCLAEKYGAALARLLPEVDCFLGASKLAGLAPALRRLAGRTHPGAGAAPALSKARRPVPRSGRWTRALMICDGCDNACTYCAIPQMRGRLRSRPVTAVVAEARMLVAQGAREIVLAGQDTASYGLDRGRNRLARLLRAVAAGSGAHWIRLAYANPERLDPDVARVMRDCPNVCHYVDLPIQHASPRMLAAMGRARSSGPARRAIEHLRKTVPDVALRTTVIVGFPGETEADFRVLLQFLREVRFDMAGVFRFSPQSGTPAAALPRQVPAEIAEQRLVEVTALQEEVAQSKARDLVGGTLEVLVEAAEGTRLCGRTAYDMAEVDRTVEIRGCRARPGEFVSARITRVVGGDVLVARPEGRGRPISLDRGGRRH